MQTTTRPTRGRSGIRNLVASAATILTAATALSTVPQSAAQATPIGGNTPLLVLLCMAKDTTAEPKPPSYFQTLFTTHDSANPTMWDYWWQVSNYTINLTYSTVSSHWIPTTKTVADLQGESREQKLQDCMNAAGGEISNPSSYYGVIAMWNVNFTMATDTVNFGDSGETGGVGPQTRTLNGVTQPYAGIVVEPWAMFPSFLEHEMGHGYGLEHAFSTANCGAVQQPGEYCDPYDTMGVSWNGLEFSEPAYAAPNGATSNSSAGPGLNAFDLDKLGFIPAGRRADVSVGAGQQSTITITSLSAPNPSGFLTIKVPLGDSPDHYYTVEYRRKLNWDAGINGDGVLIHEVKPDAVPGHAVPLSCLITKSSNWTDALFTTGQGFLDYARRITITVSSVDPATNTATVVISGPPAPTPPPSGGGGGGDNGQGAGGCGATGCGQHPPGWHPGPIHFM